MNMNAVGSLETSVNTHVSADTPEHPRKLEYIFLNIN
jgi:hypothetical protein